MTLTKPKKQNKSACFLCFFLLAIKLIVFIQFKLRIFVTHTFHYTILNICRNVYKAVAIQHHVFLSVSSLCLFRKSCVLSQLRKCIWGTPTCGFRTKVTIIAWQGKLITCNYGNLPNDELQAALGRFVSGVQRKIIVKCGTTWKLVLSF